MPKPTRTAQRTIALALVAAFALLAPPARAAAPWWTDETPRLNRAAAGLEQLPAQFRGLRIDAAGFRGALATAPLVYEGLDRGIVIELPTPDGGTRSFRVVESPILSDELQERRPDVRTYQGVGVDDPLVRVRFGIAGEQFHARVWQPGASYTISGLPGMDPEFVLAWYRRDGAPRAFECLTETIDVDMPEAEPQQVLARRLGNQLRTYRLAVSAPGELTDLVGSVSGTENLITGVVNIVNGVYERELAVTFEIVDYNVYTDPNTDPYTNGTVLDGLMINQNNSVLNNKLGINGYDVGHVIGFTPGSGTYGLAYVSAQCRSNVQGGGGTFSGGPTTAALADVVLHELGHQLGATHSFNSTLGGCEGNRSGSSAYEIGSGLTIMSYAGLCSSENVQNSDIDYFNSGALLQITNRINSTQSCGDVLNTGNLVPTVDAGPNVTIPRNTAFELIGTADDPDGDPMTYSWEQHDLGVATPPLDPASGPLFRNYAPVDEPFRALPAYNFYRRGLSPPWEFLPSVDRFINFRLIVRDNDPVSGATAWDTKTITVSGEPFAITAPNGGEIFEAGATANLTWNVGGGSVASDVRVLESADEGITWTEVIASTPNDGSVDVPAPCTVTDGARYRIEPVDNIFYDISDANFSVVAETVSPVVQCPAPVTFTTSSPDGLPKTDPQFTDFLAAIEVTDNCDTDVEFTEFAPEILPLGESNVAVIFSDDFDNTTLCVLTITVEQQTSVPGIVRTELRGAVPNPFNPRTTVRFDLARAQQARLEVVDVRGRRIAVLAEGTLRAGAHEVMWDGADDDGRRAPSGVYFLRLAAEDGEFTRRVALLK